MSATNLPPNNFETAAGNALEMPAGSTQIPGRPDTEEQKSDLPSRTTNWVALAVMALLAIGAGLAFQANRSRRVVPQGPTRQDWIDLHSQAGCPSPPCRRSTRQSGAAPPTATEVTKHTYINMPPV